MNTTLECACGTLQINRQIKSLFSHQKFGDRASDSHFTTVVIFCNLKTLRQFSTTSGPH